MSANIEVMAYVGDTPWHNLGIKLDKKPEKAAEITPSAKLDWKVGVTPMYTAHHDRVQNFHAVYREDNNEVLSVINRTRIIPVQNDQMFTPLDELLGDKIDFETVGDLGKGEVVWGCFKIHDQYKIFDDAIDHYYVVMNEHTKSDGKVTLLNTPVRVVCANTLAAGLASAFYKLRVPVVNSSGNATETSLRIFNSYLDASRNLTKQAQKMYDAKIDKAYVEKMLDKLFPYVDDTIQTEASVRSNERISMVREQFLNECMGADNLANYRGTQWQFFNAVADFSQHYFRDVSKAFDINYKMRLLPGMSTEGQGALVEKFMKMKDRISA